jgi:hypothetical protein
MADLFSPPITLIQVFFLFLRLSSKDETLSFAASVSFNILAVIFVETGTYKAIFLGYITNFQWRTII